MSEYDSALGGEPAYPVSPQSKSSKFAVAAGVSCLTPLGPILGPLFGILGLIQIRMSRGQLAGAGMAWMGLFMGLVEFGPGMAIWSYRQKLISDSPAVIAGFMDGIGKGDMSAAHDFMTDGLRPKMDKGRAQQVGEALTDALGPFKDVGELRDSQIQWGWPLLIHVQYALQFEKGAPATGRFTLMNEYGGVKVRDVRIESPVLRPSIEVKGLASQEVGEYDGPREKAGPHIKSFKK